MQSFWENKKKSADKNIPPLPVILLLQKDSICVLHYAHTLGKGMYPTILPQALEKIVGHTEIFKFGMKTDIVCDCA